jgi:hypothetical protein
MQSNTIYENGIFIEWAKNRKSTFCGQQTAWDINTLRDVPLAPRAQQHQMQAVICCIRMATIPDKDGVISRCSAGQ